MRQSVTLKYCVSGSSSTAAANSSTATVMETR